METIIIVLLVIILFLCFFIAVSMFVLGSAIMRTVELLSNISVPPPSERRKGGHRYSPEENLLDIGNTSYPFNENS